MQGKPSNLERTRRWPRPYASTWVFMGFLLVVLALLNVPGGFVIDTLALREPAFFKGDGWYVHGWPLMALRRGPFDIKPVPDLSSPWNLVESVSTIESPAIAVNAATAVLVIVLGGMLFQTWRRRGGSLLRYRLSTVFVCVTLVALAVQYLVRQRMAGRADRVTVAALSAGPEHTAPHVNWRWSGPTWLRKLLGEALFADCDRAVWIRGLESRDIAAACALRNLEFVEIGGSISNDEIQVLSELPNLQNLSLASCTPEWQPLAHWPRIDFPALTHLRRLDLSGSRFRFAGLEKLERLEVLELSDSRVGDGDLHAIGTLKKLKILSLRNTAVSNSGLAQLAGLQDLQELNVDENLLDDAGMLHVAKLNNLRKLRLTGPQITDAAIASLQQLPHLAELEAYETAISTEALAGLAGLQRLETLSFRRLESGDPFEVRHLARLAALRALSLDEPSLCDADVSSLAQFTHLDYLRIHNTKITPAGFAALRAALPNCQITGD